jgi:hypothetical protein
MSAALLGHQLGKQANPAATPQQRVYSSLNPPAAALYVLLFPPRAVLDGEKFKIPQTPLSKPTLSRMTHTLMEIAFLFAGFKLKKRCEPLVNAELCTTVCRS